MSSDKINLRRAVTTLTKAPQFDAYTRVELTVDENTVYISGTDSGRTLRVDCPWGSQEVADNILTSVAGYQYQPYTAPGALIDPSVELMDGVTIDTTYGGIYAMDLTFGPGFSADLFAPCDEETDHEFPYTPKKDREIRRRMAGMASELRVHADEISAKVEKTGGDPESFSWELRSDHHSWHANGTEVAKLSKDGLAIIGEIRATSGSIGGWTILEDRLSYNRQEWGGYNSLGAYLGPSGLQLGSWDDGFHVDMFGHLYASDGEFRGTIRAGRIEYGGEAGYMDGSGLAGHSVGGAEIGYSAVSTSHTSGGINTSLGYANFADDVFHNRSAAPNVACQTATIKGKYLGIDNKVLSLKTVTIGGQTITFLGR